ncbi:polyhydroxybutyrate depolymerase [Glaciecola sp. 2405UD65-10]|uniref:extracellular catalytic domain type 2 short-chain-length polyhydroxyalkanoate depolymerase n=1 Tax=Glaciecola sp. 2405UD65-10 TaxID=3397244 RepID=UPI003B5CBC2B
MSYCIKINRVFSALCLSALFVPNVHAQPLNINLSQSSVSGLSSGGYMATQFHLSHSETLVGAGIVSAGPYYCAQNSIMTALNACINKMADTPSDPFSYFNQAQKERLIAPLSSFADDKVWLLHGKLDTRIVRPVTDALYTQYAKWIPQENLKYLTDKNFAHVFPTLQNGGDCKISSPPFIGDCNFDAAGEILNFIYPNLQPAISSKDTYEQGKLVEFKQAELSDISGAGMNETGFAFIPNTCALGENCTIHISFHGCNQSIDNVGDSFAKLAGFNEWAVSNNIIVIYPQIKKSSVAPMNPQSCWDWWGYTNENYATKQGKQIKAVFSMMQNAAEQFAKN